MYTVLTIWDYDNNTRRTCAESFILFGLSQTDIIITGLAEKRVTLTVCIVFARTSIDFVHRKCVYDRFISKRTTLHFLGFCVW